MPDQPPAKTMWKAQCFDPDAECWEDLEEVPPSTERRLVEEEARDAARKCAYRVKTRVVPAWT